MSRALDEAMLRSYAFERCVDYGCLPADALRLRERVEQGESWPAVALELGKAHASFARQQEASDAAAASNAWLAAAACYRVAQAALEEQPAERLQAYLRQFSAFDAGARLGSGARYLEQMFLGRRHAAWLFEPPVARPTPSCVVIWGGADGWCEAFQTVVPSLHEEGLAVCLAELPGQGLARLQERSFLQLDFTDFVSGLLDALCASLGATPRFAVVGNSLGGSLALRAAAADDRIEACVTNGGSVDLELGLTAFPRVLQRFGRMLGDAVTPDAALAFIERLALPQAAGSMRASLLCVHGGQDTLVADEEVQHLLMLRPAARLLRWPEGVHCVYNVARERNAQVARWLGAELSKGLP